MNKPDLILNLKLKEFQQAALQGGNYHRALQFDEALSRLNPGYQGETDGQTLAEFGKIKMKSGDYKSALNYFTQARHHGVNVDQEVGTMREFQGEEAEKKGNYAKALRYYSLAADHGIVRDDLKLAELNMKAADQAFLTENSRWLRANYAVALDFYDTAIHLYSKNKKLSEVLFKRRWLDHYLTALKYHNELPRGIDKLSRHVDQMIHYIKEEQPLSKSERTVRIAKIRPYIQKTLQILDVMVQHDSKNPEHHFRRGLLYDYLNYAGENTNPRPHYQRAVDLQPENPLYLVSYIKTCWAQNYPLSETYRGYYSSERCSPLEFWYENERWKRSVSPYEAIY